MPILVVVAEKCKSVCTESARKRKVKITKYTTEKEEEAGNRRDTAMG
jgi:hypothetical protein